MCVSYKRELRSLADLEVLISRKPIRTQILNICHVMGSRDETIEWVRHVGSEDETRWHVLELSRYLYLFTCSKLSV